MYQEYKKNLNEPLTYFECLQLLSLAVKKGVIERDPKNKFNIIVIRKSSDGTKEQSSEDYMKIADEMYKDVHIQQQLIQLLQEYNIEIKFAKTVFERLPPSELVEVKKIYDEVLSRGGRVDIFGNIVLYHRTTEHAKREILKSKIMYAKEDGIYFSTKECGQNAGYGNAVLAFSIPADLLEVDDVFDDEIHFRFPLGKKRYLDVSDFLIEDVSPKKRTREKRQK